MNSTNSI